MRAGRGFTILGVVVAAAMVTIVVEAVALLTVRALSSGRVSRERVIATQLAREGVELVRSLRDDNWFSYAGGTGNTMQWRGDPAGDGEQQRRAICNGVWIIDPVRDRLQDPVALGVPALINGELYSTVSGGVNLSLHDGAGTKTIYRRLITIETIDANGDGVVGNCGESVYGLPTTPLTPMPDPIRVTSTVSWRERDTDPWQSVVLRAELYDFLKTR